MIDKGMCGKFVVGHMIKGGAVFMGLTRMVFDFWCRILVANWCCLLKLIICLLSYM